MSEIVHRCPIGSESVTPCCGKTPFELSQWESRITLDDSLVTCGKMNTDHDLLAKIDAMIENNTLRWFNLQSWAFASEPADRGFKALRAVVEREGWMETDIGTEKELGYRMGYNQCLADVKADIEKVLGNEN